MNTQPLSALPTREGLLAKTVLLLGCGAGLAFALTPAPVHPFARAFMAAAVLVALLYALSRSAPCGYEDKTGFHLKPRSSRRRRSGSRFAPQRWAGQLSLRTT